MNDWHIICGNCHQRHPSVEAIKACYAGKTKTAAPEQKELSVTRRQLDYIKSLNGDVSKAMTLTIKEASNYIDQLKKAKRMSNPIESAPNRLATKVPLDMLANVPDGYYAAQLDSTQAFTFFRISRPKSGQFKGTLKIQTQHGPDYKLAMVVWSFERQRVTVYNKAIEDELLLVCVDHNGCAIAYAEKIGRCMRCNTELTDERSRWYGIGPECEKHWPYIIDLVNDRKGEYVPGWADR